MCKGSIDKEEIEKLESKFNCKCSVKCNCDGSLHSLTTEFSEETKLLFTISEGADGNESLFVKVLKAPFEDRLVREIEDKMLVLMKENYHYQNLMLKVSRACQMMQTSMNHQMQQSQMECKTPDVASIKASKTSLNSKGAVLAAKFSKPLTVKGSLLKNSDVKKGGKKPAMKTAEDVIKRLTLFRIKWDNQLDESKFIVGCEDRFVGTVEKPFSEIDWKSDIASVGPNVVTVLQHRIQYFKFYERKVWDKKSRLDDMFGSTGSGKTILDVMKEEEEESEVMQDDACEDKVDDDSSHPIDELSTLGIHSEKKVDDAPQQVKGGRRTYPTHFVCIRVNRNDILSSVSQYLNELTKGFQSREEREKFFQYCYFEKLHITLCTCTVESSAQVDAIKQVFKEMFVYGNQLSLKLQGIGEFGQNVVYAKVNSPALCSLEKRLVEALKEKLINLDGNYSRYIPHMTLFNLPYNARYITKRIGHLIHNKRLKRWRFTNPDEPFLADELYLCKIGSLDRSNGNFYQTLASAPIQVRSRDPEDLVDDSDPFPSSSQKRSRRNVEDDGSQHAEEERRSSKLSKSDVMLSKSLAAVLRHNKFGFQIDSEGFVYLNAILSHQRFRGATKEDIYRVVERNEKKRFSLDTDEDGFERIKANQGHSVEVENLSLIEITDPAEYPTVVHGTFRPAWKIIEKCGLHRRKRIHIHMTTAEPSHDDHVLSGMRKSCTVFIYVDIAAAMQDGIHFFVSSNGVVLSSGDENGYIQTKYFSRVVGLKHGQRFDLLRHPDCLEREDDVEDQDDAMEETALKRVPDVSDVAKGKDDAREETALERVPDMSDVAKDKDDAREETALEKVPDVNDVANDKDDAVEETSLERDLDASDVAKDQNDTLEETALERVPDVSDVANDKDDAVEETSLERDPDVSDVAKDQNDTLEETALERVPDVSDVTNDKDDAREETALEKDPDVSDVAKDKDDTMEETALERDPDVSDVASDKEI